MTVLVAAEIIVSGLLETLSARSFRCTVWQITHAVIIASLGELDNMLASLKVHAQVFSQILPVHVGAGEGVVESRRLEDGRGVSLNNLTILSDLLVVTRTTVESSHA